MRKLLIIATLLVELPLFAAHVDPETARNAATSFLNANGMKVSQLTDISKAAGFSNLYLFNAEGGFVLMAADDCVKPVLGYSLTGAFKVENLPENISSWLQGYNDEIQGAIERGTKANEAVSEQWKALLSGNPKTLKATPVVGPLIQTHWDQDSPYNNLCPSGTVTGCVATAMAQVMKYWNYPPHGIGSHSYIPENNASLGELTADFNATFYDWSNMTNTYGGSSTTAQRQAVAQLMYHCGVSVSMKYGPSSGAFTGEVATALKNYFNYSSETQFLERTNFTENDWINRLKADLDLSRPIQYSGNGSGGGHSFICDGYDSDNYFHFNWGWSGSCDAYYTVNNLNPGPGGIGSGAYGVYNSSQGAVFGIHPSECTIDAPTGLSYTQNGRDITLNWTAASGAVSYNLYQNSNFIGNTATTSFSVTAPFGSTNYYVRSVDASDGLSLSSNAVLVTVGYPIPVVDDLETALSGNTIDLNWTAPDWCFPETESSILTYGDGTSGSFLGFQGASELYWGHRYLPSDLIATSGKVIFRVSFFVREPGLYQLLLYSGTSTVTSGSDTYEIPTTLLANKSFTTTQTGWFAINLDEPIAIDNGQDLWVMLYDPELKYMPAEYCLFNEHDRGSYYSNDLTSWTLTIGNAFLIRTYLTDGTYTYNLYQDGVRIAEDLSTTTYQASLNDNAANMFTVKTNYYGGETTSSNKKGYAKGTTTMVNLELESNDMMTLTSGSSLTVSGTLSNTNSANLVIDDGAQLIHNTNGVKAKVKKSIEPYTADDNGWYFITSPITEDLTPTIENGLLQGHYDLYYYDEPTSMWKNRKASVFDLHTQQGYLYANEALSTLSFEGTLLPSNSPVSIKNLSHSASSLNGFHLLGNPFICNATVDQDCFIIDGGSVVLAPSAKVLAPCEGFFIKATSDEYVVTFTKAGAKEEESKASLDLVLSQNENTLDRIRLRFDKGIDMETINLDGQERSRLSFSQNGIAYAVAYLETPTETPVHFKAFKNGTYTIRMESMNLDLDYLHLIDHLTGANIDLLQCPSYCFEAKASDYPSRFQLVFSDTTQESGNLNGQAEGTLQIFDMTGRLVATDRKATLAPGVYLLRTIHGNDITTEKIIIK